MKSTAKAKDGAALAREIERGGINLDDWSDPEPVSKPERLDVTLSVRFSDGEIATIRQRAERAGLKPTTYIRRCVLAADDTPLNRARVAKAVAAIAKEVEQLQRATA